MSRKTRQLGQWKSFLGRIRPAGEKALGKAFRFYTKGFSDYYFPKRVFFITFQREVNSK